MHSKTVIYFDDNDPSPMGKRLAEAFNRTINFCPELLEKDSKGIHRPRELTSHNRVIGGEFDLTDIATLSTYAAVVHARIMAKYPATDIETIERARAVVRKHGDSGDPFEGNIIESMHQAAKNLVEVMQEITRYVYAQTNLCP